MARKQRRPDRARVRVRVFGTAEITVGDARITLRTEALFAVALLLTTRAGERVHRDELLAMFWPGPDTEQRRHRLRQMLYRLRRQGFALVEDGECLWVDAAAVDSDLRDALAPGWPKTATAETVIASRDVTPVFSARMTPGFLAWYDAVRDALLKNVRSAAQAHIVLARRDGRWEDVDALARTILASDPLNEEAVLLRAESVAMTGEKLEAIEILDRYIAEIGLVKSDLGRPAFALRKRIAERRPDWKEPAPLEVRLIGRTEQMRVLTSCVDGLLAGHGSHCQLVGAPGIGKSRLLAEARGYARLRGVRVVAVEATPIMQTCTLTLYSAVIAKLLDLPGAAGTPPFQLEMLRTLVTPATDAGFSVEPPALQTWESLARATHSLVQAIAAEMRLVLTVDDLQYADDASLRMLFELERATVGSRCCVLTASRLTEWLREPEELGRMTVPVCKVGPLSAEESDQLFMEVLVAHKRPPRGAGTGALKAGAGNPLFIRELALSGRTLEGGKLPESLTQLIQSRLGALPEFHVRVLRVACLLGDMASIAHVKRLCPAPPKALQDAVARLELDGILAAAGDGILYLHDAWRANVEASMPATVRVALALECAEVLRREPGDMAQQQSIRAAHLLDIAGERAEALSLLLQSSDALYAAGLANVAMEHLDSLAKLTDSPAAVLKVDARRARLHLLGGEPEIASELVQRCLESEAIGEVEVAAERLMAGVVGADVAMRLDRLHTYSLDVLTGAAFSPALDNSLRHVACLAGVRFAANSYDTEMLLQFANECRRIDDANSPTSVAAWMTHLIREVETGTPEAIGKALRSLSTQTLEQSGVAERCLVERVACGANRVFGDHETSAAHGRSAFHLALDYGLSHQARLAADSMAFMFLDYQNLKKAREWIDRGFALQAESPYGITRHSTTHAEDRLILQAGEADVLLHRIRKRLPQTRIESRSPNSLGQLAMAALALAQCGDKSEAATYIDAVIANLPDELGFLGLHFTIELSVRALRLVDRIPEANDLLARHMGPYLKAGRPELPPFYVALRSLSLR